LNFYFVATVYDQHNYTLNPVSESFISATGGSVVQTVSYESRNYTVHRFTSAGTFTFQVTDAGTFNQNIKYTVFNGSFDGDTDDGTAVSETGSYTVVVNSGGRVDIAYPQDEGTNDIPFNVINPVPILATGGTVSAISYAGEDYTLHRFTSPGTSTFSVTSTGNISQDVKFITSGNSSLNSVSNIRGSFTATVQNYTVSVGSGGFVDIVYSQSSITNEIPYTEIRSGSGESNDPAASPSQLDAFVRPAGTYSFQPSGFASPIQLSYRPQMQDSRGWVLVFSSPYRSTATVNRVGQNIPWKGILVQRNNNQLRGYTYFTTTQLFNNRDSTATSTGGNRSGYRVFLGGPGSQGIYNTSQNPCSWGDSGGAVGAGWDGSTCGSFPNDLVWGTGQGGTPVYANRSGTWENWIWWD
jgi:hypothetical protein